MVGFRAERVPCGNAENREDHAVELRKPREERAMIALERATEPTSQDGGLGRLTAGPLQEDSIDGHPAKELAGAALPLDRSGK
jgi:hypothetical protein